MPKVCLIFSLEFECEMSSDEAGYIGDYRSSLVPRDDGSDLFRRISLAVFEAIIEDWTAESLELYQATAAPVAVRQLPDDTIEIGSALQYQLQGQLVGGSTRNYVPPSSVREFLSLAVSGSRVLEDETVLCRVVWVSSGEVAEALFSLLPETHSA